MNELESTEDVTVKNSDSEFNSVDDIPYVPVPGKDAGTIRVKIESITEGEPLPYPFDDYGFDSVEDIPYGFIPLEHVETIRGPFKIVDLPMIPYPLED